MSSIVRESKFRNVSITVSKRELHYENLKISDHLIETQGIAANSRFVAYLDTGGAGSAIGVLPLSSVGKVHVPKSVSNVDTNSVSTSIGAQPIIRAHAQAVQDIRFNPFNSYQLASTSMDGKVKLWELPEDGLETDLSSPMSTMTTDNSVQFRELAFHPYTCGIVVARSARSISLFDYNAGTPIVNTAKELFSADLHGISWSGLGDLIVVSGKDKKISMLDLRRTISESTCGIVMQAAGHTGSKGSRVTWLGQTPYFVSTGHTPQQEREMFLWDSRLLDKPVKRERFDTSTGLMLPLFEPDTNLLVTIGRGDSSLKLYEVSASGGELFPIGVCPIGEIVRGGTIVGKHGLDLTNNEVVRVLTPTAGAIIPVSIKVPRRDKRFQADLYPPSFWDAPAALDAQQWLAGELSAPRKVPVEEPAVRQLSSAFSDSPLLSASMGKNVSLLDLDRNSEVSRIDSTATDDSVGSGQPDSNNSRTSTLRGSTYGSALRFRHLYGSEPPKLQTYFNVRPNSVSDHSLIACSPRYWAVPFQGSGGGPVYVSQHGAFGQVISNCPLINGHRAPVTDLSFSPFHNGLLATAGQDMRIMLWQLPEEPDVNTLLTSMTEADSSTIIAKHSQTIRSILFHPCVHGLLAATSVDMTVRLFDIATNGQEISSIPLQLPSESCTPINFNFNIDGSLIALACKDRVLRLLDPRSQQIVSLTPDPATSQLGRQPRLAWCCGPGAADGAIVTTSIANTGMRTVHAWDPRNLSQPVATRPVDTDAGPLYPLYDEGSGLCFVAGKGDTIIRYYETTFLSTTPRSPRDSGIDTFSFDKANEFQSGKESIVGIGIMSPRCVDVKNVEVTRLLKLTTDSVVPISFTLARASQLKQYFQDDVYLPQRSRTATVTVADWCNSSPNDVSFLRGNFESLQPSDMLKVSQKPVEAPKRPKTIDFRAEINQRDAEAKAKDQLINRLGNLANLHASYHPNRSGGAGKANDPTKIEEDDEIDWDNEP